MRLHTLAVQAFGPFPGRVEVDLDELASAGIFLIHGPTGAGKTSLLDAICFALYAAVPGARPAGRSLRSDHAPCDAVPRVELQLSAGGRRLRIARSPELRRPKRRGTGETTMPASVVLSEWVGDDWVALSQRADEVGLLVRDVVGMGLEQFVKVVLLPQGDFAAFLRASPESRRQLLERLFDVSRFTDIEDWLVQQRRVTAGLLADAKAALATHLTRIDDVLARLPPDLCCDVPPWPEVPAGELDVTLATAQQRVRELAANALAESAAAEAREREGQAARHAASRQTICRQKGEAAHAELAELSARQEELDALAESVAVGRRASCVVGDLRALADVLARSAAAAGRGDAAAADAAALGLRGVTDTGQANRLADDVARFESCLAEAASLEASLAAARRRLIVQQQLLARAERSRSSVDKLIEQLVVAAAETARLAQAAAATAAGLPQAQAQLDEATLLVRRRSILDDRLRQLAAATERAHAAAEVSTAARGRWLDLRQSYLEGMAARLAASLVDGHPCPVCGSAHHPSPADVADAVPDDVVSGAESDWTTRQADLAASRSELAALQGQVRASQEELGVQLPDAQALSAELAAAQHRFDTATAQAEQLVGLRERAGQLEAELTAAREQRDQAERIVREAAGRLAAMHAETLRTESELGERRHRHTDGCPCGRTWSEHPVAPSEPVASQPEAAVMRHRAVAGALAELLQAIRARTEAREHESTTTRAVAKRLSENGFGCEAEARAALVPQETLAGYERVLGQAERSRVQAQTVLADPEVRDALAANDVDVTTLDEELSQARRARQLADRSSALAEQSDAELTGLRRLVREAAAQLGERSERHAAMTRLADTAVGLGPDNAMRMRLSSYALAGRLERIVELANERLTSMGDGRYRLRHSDAPVAGGRRSGLGLAIEDLWTGRVRDTATLSGGESFIASLALALGLADGVREEAGGFDLQTLFVDEGFGSLDEDSLEQVLDVLDDLRDGGRAVGVVSHVAELRARIPNQLHVTKTAGGSQLHMVGGDDSPA